MRAHWFLAVAALAHAQDLPRGQVIPDVPCAADPSHSYALYLPSGYRADRTWSVILAFDPGARGRLPVERLQAAAEAYGYIVAGSNNSRNGSWNASFAAADALSKDVFTRFAIDPKRVYLAGFSGGARVAMAFAMGTGRVAGVIAASAGFPDSTPRKSLPFVVFATAGTDDFNYREMREVDRHLTSPHRTVIFEGGHGWPPPDLAGEAVEWLELQAMRSGLRSRDEAILDHIFSQRQSRLTASASRLDKSRELDSLVADFSGLRDVTALAARAQQLLHDKSVREAGRKERAAEESEARQNAGLEELVAGLRGDASVRGVSLAQLRSRLTDLAGKARDSQDSSERRLARRLLGGIIVASENSPDPDYRKLVEQVRPAVFP